MVIRLYVFAMWVGAGRAVHTRRHHYLVTYHHQLTLPSSYLASPLGSSLHRLVWLALRGRVAWWAVGVHLSHVAHHACGPVLGTVAGTAVRVHPSSSVVFCIGMWAPLCRPLVDKVQVAIRIPLLNLCKSPELGFCVRQRVYI